MKLACLAFSILCAVVAHAQTDMGGSMFDMSYRPFAVMQRKDIKAELKLSKEQAKQIDEIIKEFNKQSGRAADPGAGMAMFGKINETDKNLIAVLDEAQKQRLSEIRIQMRGATALSDPEIAQKLELTEDQVAGVKKSRAAALQELLTKARSGKTGGMEKAMEEISKAEEKELLALLTDAQKESFAKMAGTIYKNARLKGMWPI